MSDPKRLRTSGTPLERRLLASVRDVTPPPDAHAAVWASLATHVSVGTVGATTGAFGVTAKSVGAVWIKGAAVILATGAIAVTATMGRKTPSDAPPASPGPSAISFVMAAPSVAPVPATATASVSSDRVSEPRAVAHASTDSIDASVEPEPVATDPVSTATEEIERQTRLREETALMTGARAALRAGNWTTALATLDDAALRFPAGTLVQERRALRVEALARMGNVDAARTEADAFGRDYPTSPYLKRVRAFAP